MACNATPPAKAAEHAAFRPRNNCAHVPCTVDIVPPRLAVREVANRLAIAYFVLQSIYFFYSSSEHLICQEKAWKIPLGLPQTACCGC
jgi:hypothetical protein